MLARMAISRIVTAPDVSASPAQAKMHPSVAHGEAFLTTIAAWVHRPYRIEVGTLLPSFSHWYTPLGSELMPARPLSRTSRAHRALSSLHRTRRSSRSHAFAKPPAYFSNNSDCNGSRRPRAVVPRL